MARIYPSSRARLEALAGGTLGPADSLRVRADHHTDDSATLALERWALRPLTAGDRAERLKLLADTLPPEGARLARLALVVDTEAPADHFVAAIKALAASPTDPDEAGVYWQALAVDLRAPEGERAAALLELGLIRKRQGRSGEALDLLRHALPLGGESAATVALQVGHTLLERGEYEAALVAYREAESRHAWNPKARTGLDRLVPFVLYQGICLEHLGRVREAVAEYASVLLRAPLWWRRPLALHLIELYEAAGRSDVLMRFLDGAGEERYAATIPVRTLMIVHRLERDGDWPSLVANIQGARSAVRTTAREDRGRAYAQTAAAHALARHCDDTVPLLSAVDDGEREFVAYARGLCVPGSNRYERQIRADLESERVSPELGFPPVKRVDLPDPIVCAEHLPPSYDGSKVPCP
jgi:tetratricopeptide (TPR) repeat protein